MMKQLKFTLYISLIWIFSNAQNSEHISKNRINTNYETEIVVRGLQIPWGFTFLPDNSILITEKRGELFHFKDGKKIKVIGLPTIEEYGQGGLMDIELHPDFINNDLIYFTYTTSQGIGIGYNTAVMRARFKNGKLHEQILLYKASPNSSEERHFGSSIAFDDKGYLYFSIGDRGNRDLNPQDITRDGGKIYRLKDDGSIPEDNPFVDTNGAKKAVYSYGHSNPQGIELNPFTGDIWIHEHGPRGGDEINIIKKGKNYGWPKVSFGTDYSGFKFADNTSSPEMVDPLYYWNLSFAPSGMTFVTSDQYSKLKGHLLVGSLRSQLISICILRNGKVIDEVPLLEGIGRVRSIEQGKDGYLYFSVENLGILKLIPK